MRTEMSPKRLVKEYHIITSGRFLVIKINVVQVNVDARVSGHVWPVEPVLAFYLVTCLVSCG